MAKIDLTQYGITGTTEIVYNPSYEMLFEEETKPGLEGFEKGQVSELGAVNVMTGIYTGRSPKDKFIVMDDVSKDTVWWTSDEYKNDNHPASQESVGLTLKTGTTWFWSRSRQELWNKGATSGNMQEVKELWADCDSDTLLVKVDSPGPACHTGNRTCFFKKLA